MSTMFGFWLEANFVHDTHDDAVDYRNRRE